jgi:hypothetical protein
MNDDHEDDVADEFVDAPTFSEWCDRNNDVICNQLNQDPWEVLHQAWLGGFLEGGRFVKDLTRRIG